MKLKRLNTNIEIFDEKKVHNIFLDFFLWCYDRKMYPRDGIDRTNTYCALAIMDLYKALDGYKNDLKDPVMKNRKAFDTSLADATIRVFNLIYHFDAHYADIQSYTLETIEAEVDRALKIYKTDDEIIASFIIMSGKFIMDIADNNVLNERRTKLCMMFIKRMYWHMVVLFGCLDFYDLLLERIKLIQSRKVKFQN